MKRTPIHKIMVAALLGAGSLTLAPTPAHAGPPAIAEAHLPLRATMTPPRRPIEARPCGLFAIGRARPRTALPQTAMTLAATPLIAIEGPLVDHSRATRAATRATTTTATLRILGGLPARFVHITRPTATPTDAPTDALAALRIDRARLDASRRARATLPALGQLTHSTPQPATAPGLITLDPAHVDRSRLARALAAR